MESLVIPGSEPPTEATTSAAKAKLMGPQELLEFEDFSTKPPEELLRRSGRIANTSSPPPTKKWKTTPSKKSIPAEMANKDKDVIPPKLSKMPVSTTLPMVDRKLKRLVNKIDSNHSDLLKAIENIVHHMTGTSFSIQKDDFGQPLHVVEEQQAPIVLEEYNDPNKSDFPTEHDQSYGHKDIQAAEPSKIIQDMDDVSEYHMVSDTAESLEQHVANDTLKDNASEKSNYAMKDAREVVDNTDQVEEHVEQIDKDKINPDLLDSTTLTSISFETREVVDSLIYGLSLSATLLTSISHEQAVQAECLLRDSQLSTTLPSKPNVLQDDVKTPLSRSRMPSKMLQSPYLTNFGLSKKVAFSQDKNWFYLMSKPNRCCNDEHFDVIFYYLRKKSKMQLVNQYRHTTTNYIFKVYIKSAQTRYYHIPPDIFTQKDMTRAFVVAHHERSVKNIIRGFSIPTDLIWHLVDEVYILLNYDRDSHWILTVVVLKQRLIRVYDSSSGIRSRNPSLEIEKIVVMLPTYFHGSDFLRRMNVLIGHHLIHTRTNQPMTCLKHITLLKLNILKALCNKKAIAYEY
ncbi:uncharacterized protein LOC129890465 [Solanum dulcamara]|uniref:uncharacterized protein LOC129890465 n=1 Tax=Solanum dulcamara TaxID=45834 RepID=UPI0024863D1B|nr:uncharacterized protein LOC129890465 [Solanum dulcamara]